MSLDSFFRGKLPLGDSLNGSPWSMTLKNAAAAAPYSEQNGSLINIKINLSLLVNRS